MLQLRKRGKGNRIPNVVAAGTGATPAAFYLGLCRLRGILSPPASATVILQAGCSSVQLRWCCRRAVLSCSSDDAASIRKSGLEIKNRCSLWAVLEGFFASIRKSEPEIKNRCTKEGVNREKLASIRKSEPEIKNRCNRGVVGSWRSAGGTISFAGTKNRIRRGSSLSPRSLQAKPFPFAATKIRIGRGPHCRDDRSRRTNFSLRRRRLESDADIVAATTTAGGPFFSAAKKIRIGRGDSLQKVSHPQQIPSTRSIMR